MAMFSRVEQTVQNYGHILSNILIIQFLEVNNNAHLIYIDKKLEKWTEL